LVNPIAMALLIKKRKLHWWFVLPFATIVVAQNRLQNLSDDFIESALYGAFHILSL